jgi:thymidylate synthase
MCDSEYQDLLARLLYRGEIVTTRNSKVARSIAEVKTFDRTPLVCCRRTAWKNALREWEWFLSGSCNLRDLHPDVQSWWRPWANHNGDVFFNYSWQLRGFVGMEGRMCDQISYLVDGVKDHPYSRRNVITTWNTADMTSPDCPITNCHGTVIQAFVDTRNYLTLVTYQRSADVVCGLPHNWVQYWAFLLWLAHRGGREPRRLVWLGGDVHLYEVHKDLASEVIKVAPSTGPELVYTSTSEDFRADDFALDGPYHPRITTRAEMVI